MSDDTLRSSSSPPFLDRVWLWIAAQANGVTTCVNCSAETRYKWMFGFLGIIFFHVAFSCFSLAWRMLLQQVFAIFTSLTPLTIAGIWKQRDLILRSEEYTKKVATVVTSKDYPGNPPMLIAPKSVLKVAFEQEGSENGPDQSEETFRDQREEDEESRSLFSLVSNHGHEVGSTIKVHLIDGDRSKAIYIPYVEDRIRTMWWQLLRNIAAAAICLLLLIWSYDVSPFFVSSAKLEASIKSSWYCQDGDDDTITEQEREEDYKICCSIPWHVTWSYNICVTAMILFPYGIVAWYMWKSRNEMLVSDNYIPLRDEVSSDDTTGIQNGDGSANPDASAPRQMS